MNFLKNLDELLKINKMNKSDLSRAVNIAPSTINAWYNGKYENISLSILLKISKYFNISLETLINGNIDTIIFTAEDFSKSELKAIKDFSNFIKSTREEIAEEFYINNKEIKGSAENE